MPLQAAYIAIVIVYQIVVILAIIHVVMDNRQPVKTLAWALVIYFVPLVGLGFYLIFGVNTRKERLISKRSLDQLSRRAMLNFVEQRELSVPAEHKQTVDFFARQNEAMPFKDNDVEIITSGYAFIFRLLRDIAKAQSHIHLNMFIFDDDPLGRLVADALKDKAAQGVEVKLIYDDVGCWHVSNNFFESLREAGIEATPFLPVRFPQFTSKVNYRNHRKIVVIDGTIGYIGGMNIARRYVQGNSNGAWRDTMVRIVGGAVYALQRAFLVDWFFVDRTLVSNRKYYPPLPPTLSNNCLSQVVTSGPVSPYPEIMQGYVRVILSARQSIYLQTPYFLPTEPVLLAMKTAALGGIDVRLMVPQKGDSRFVEWASRAYLREVMEADVKVYLYSAGFLHSKTLVVDDTLCTTGSTNIDFRSFENNFEANIFFYHQPTAMRFKQMFLDDQSHCILLNDIDAYRHPKFIVRLGESLARLLAPLL